jgi:hypothetical protein
LVIVSQTLSHPDIINTNRNDDYDIFNQQINIHLDNFFWTTKRLSRTSTFLVSRLKGQVEKYVNVEACDGTCAF